MDRLIAHTRKLNHDQLEWQTLQEHSCNVAKLCSEICEPFGLGKLGLLTGWLHESITGCTGPHTEENTAKVEPLQRRNVLVVGT